MPDTCNMPRATGSGYTLYSANITHFQLLDTACISPRPLVSLTYSIFCRRAWMDPAETGPYKPSPPPQGKAAADDEARPERKRETERGRDRATERRDGAQVGAFSHLES